MLLPLLLAFAAAAAQSDDLYQQGASLLKSGRSGDAIAAFEALTRTAPSDPRGWRALGVAHASIGDYKRAAEPLRKACDLDPRDPDGCYYLGLASYNLGRYDGAVMAYTKALKASGRTGRAHTGLGLTYEALGRTADAERELREGVAQHDGRGLPDSDARVEYGAFLFRQGRLDDALKTLEASRPDSPRAHFEVARILSQKGDLDSAASRLEKAIALDPQYAAAHLLLGRVYFRMGRTAEGERQTGLGQKLSAPKQ
jgi:tetratricopeptide (TPR) repeat protein